MNDAIIYDALREVEDPEAGMNIVDLGLVYSVVAGDDAVQIEMTMTTAACPMTDMIADGVRNAVASVTPEGTQIDVRLVWDPPWTPDRMSGIAKEHFGWAR